MKYLVIDPPDSARITFERAQGGHLYQRPDGTYVLVRTSWPFPSPSLVALDAIPDDWTEITA